MQIHGSSVPLQKDDKGYEKNMRAKQQQQHHHKSVKGCAWAPTKHEIKVIIGRVVTRMFILNGCVQGQTTRLLKCVGIWMKAATMCRSINQKSEQHTPTTYLRLQAASAASSDGSVIWNYLWIFLKEEQKLLTVVGYRIIIIIIYFIKLPSKHFIINISLNNWNGTLIFLLSSL